MQANDIGAIIVESGSSLDYFTGVQWSRSERVTVHGLGGAHRQVAHVLAERERARQNETSADEPERERQGRRSNGADERSRSQEDADRDGMTDHQARRSP